MSRGPSVKSSWAVYDDLRAAFSIIDDDNKPKSIEDVCTRAKYRFCFVIRFHGAAEAILGKGARLPSVGDMLLFWDGKEYALSPAEASRLHSVWGKVLRKFRDIDKAR